VRHLLTGYGPTARQRRLARSRTNLGSGYTPSAEQMDARKRAIDDLLS
jgi:hypothetical protein